MAEAFDSDQERSLPASPRRLEQAREEGQVARSRALAHLAVIGVATGAFWVMGDRVVDRLRMLVARALSLDHEVALDASAMVTRLGWAAWEGVLAVLPILAVLAVAAIGASIALGGWLFTFKSVAPQFSRIDPVKGFGRLASKQSLIELGKVIVEAAAIAGAIVLFLKAFAPDLAAVVTQSRDGGLATLVGIVLSAGLAMIVALTISAAVDVPLQIWRHFTRLRMTPEEARREARETEGDPQLRARIRSVQREMARRRMMQEVPKADVVITNPSHYAVALCYDDAADGAPRLVAKGVNQVAERIRAVAAEHAVAVLESPALARALYRHGELGEVIPEALYRAVAQVLAYVFHLRAARAAGLDTPTEFAPVEIPAGLDPLGATR